MALRVMTADHDDRGWRHRTIYVDGPNTSARLSWHLFKDSSLGIGALITRNDDEGDLQLSIYLGRIGSVYLAACAPWTAFARVGRDQDEWYRPRLTGLRLFPRKDVWVQLRIEDRDGVWERGQPWWRCAELGKRQVWGRLSGQTEEIESGDTIVPLPEGPYDATWARKRVTRRHVRWPGTWRDALLGPRTHEYVTVDIPGGVPVEGKGENAWDCGMDGVFGVSGGTVEEAIGFAVKAVLRDRKRYGGPHDLDRPTTVSEVTRG